MKLSKAQQEVVNKMRAGWGLKFSSFSGGYLYKPNYDRICIATGTIKALITRVVIENTAEGNNYAAIYRLTEQYKTKPE